MKRCACLVGFLVAGAAGAEEFTPAPAGEVPNYFAGVMPCKIERDGRTWNEEYE